MNENQTPKGTTWKRRRAGAVAAVALSALTLIGVASQGGSANAGPGWGGRAQQTTTTKAPATTMPATAAATGWGD
jgi:hypothetical protein